LFWAALLWVIAGELPFALRDNWSGRAPADRGSKQVVQGLTVVAVFIAFFAAARFREASISAAALPIYLVGVAFVAAGGLLRRHCFRMLGDSFTFDVRVAPGQQVVERGAYRYIRHPSYSAGLLLFLGIGLALDNWISLAAAALVLIGYAYRIRVEERALLAGLGSPYAEYMKRTRRLIPFVI
jgi:protein-S-isoprenylcysteine O-methyltransferase Ste14